MAIHLDTEARRQRRREYNKRYALKNPEAKKESLRKYNNKPEVKARRDKWHAENNAAVKASRHKYYLNNKQEIFEKASQFARKHPEWKAAHCAKRRAKKLKATPVWLTDNDYKLIENFYLEAGKKTKETGIKYTVDHIVPLQGKLVCGLHVPYNLQILSSTENFSKGNKFEN